MEYICLICFRGDCKGEEGTRYAAVVLALSGANAKKYWGVFFFMFQGKDNGEKGYFCPICFGDKYEWERNLILLFCFRGEKLYVTKAEGSSGRWKKILCWVVALLLLAGAIAVAVLIGGTALWVVL